MYNFTYLQNLEIHIEFIEGLGKIFFNESTGNLSIKLNASYQYIWYEKTNAIRQCEIVEECNWPTTLSVKDNAALGCGINQQLCDCNGFEIYCSSTTDSEFCCHKTVNEDCSIPTPSNAEVTTYGHSPSVVTEIGTGTDMETHEVSQTTTDTTTDSEADERENATKTATDLEVNEFSQTTTNTDTDNETDERIGTATDMEKNEFSQTTTDTDTDSDADETVGSTTSTKSCNHRSQTSEVFESAFIVGRRCVEETPEVSEVHLTSDPNSVTFSTSVVDPLKEDGPFELVASLRFHYGGTLETVNGNYLKIIASNIVTIDIYDKYDNKISINCKIYFPVIKDVTTENNSNVNLIPACHYKHDLNDSSALWSTDGCVTEYANDYMISGVTCICTHMTSFVILIKPEQINNKTLSVLTTVGVSISNVFLIITLVICCFKDLRNSDRYRILRHLVIALLCVNLFFLLLEVDVKNSIACSLLAGCLHYSLLTAFSWMLIMSTDIYMKIKYPFADHERRFSYSRYIGWIGPVIVVGTTVAITRQNYASDKCWLDTGSGAIWAFVSPACLTLLIVLAQLVIISYIAFKKSQLPNQTGQEMESLKRIRTLFSGILLLTPAVGIPWIFGVIIVFCDWEAFQYIYVIFNSMQGFFIWLSQCAFSKEVRGALIKKFSNQISQESTTMVLHDSSK